MSIVVPAVLPSSRAELEEKLALFTTLPSVKRIQIDVVDGKFAAPTSWPYSAPLELEAMVQKGEMLPALERVEYEIDLMCYDADQAAGAWLALGATRLTLHAESTTDLPRLLARVRGRYGEFVSLGIAVNAASDLALIEPFLGLVAYVQFMGIARIGQQGQPFDERVLEKVRTFHARHPEFRIQVDGGVSLVTAKKLLSLGANELVVGSALLRGGNPAEALRGFESLERPFGV